MDTGESSRGPILVVGSGNGESVLHLHENLRLDCKYEVDCYELYGGSGVNYTLRLLNAGMPVFPVLPLGKDDLGSRIRREILAAAAAAGAEKKIVDHVSGDEFLNENLSTQRAVILVETARRTIFADKARKDGRHFLPHLKKALDRFRESFSSDAPVMIGHIHSDHPDCCNERPGECARHIIENFSENSAVFCNFGAGQICMGADFWEEDLVKTRLFQLNLSEIKSFFSKKSPSPSLSDILDWFRARELSVVVTLDKFGSIASYKGGRDGVVIAWPREFSGFLDPTGAGDAFFSGLVHDLYKTPDFTFSDFYNAIETATVWATYACGHFGGSSNCPDRRTIDDFKADVFHRGKNNQILTLKEADLILRVFDRMTGDRPV